MSWRSLARGLLPVTALLLAGTLYAQRGRMRAFEEENDVPLPPDAEDPAEYSFARLIYHDADGGWGRRNGSWHVDSPAAERHFLQGVRRLTGIHARAKEKYVGILDDELFDYPWAYAVEVGHWSLSEAEAARLREYLLRGGFLMVDDFHGTSEWDTFVEGMHAVFPDRPIVDVPESDPVFHVFYDVDTKVQIPGVRWVYTGQTYERDGVEPHWRGIYDDQGRLMVMIDFNMDLGDAWEWADFPDYPEKWTALAYRYGINYIVYAMTH
jgi:hypothetical protein